MRTWNGVEALCDPTWNDEAVPVRIRADVNDEPYRAHAPQREFAPRTVPSGIRTRVIGYPYTQARGGAVRRIGEAEAYFYHEDVVLLLWRCRLLQQFRSADPTNDANLHFLWESFENPVAARFPGSRATITPSWNRPYPPERWKAFLAVQGFTRPSPAGILDMAFIRSSPDRPSPTTGLGSEPSRPWPSSRPA